MTTETFLLQGFLNTYSMQAITNSFVTVDTFFLISGTLMAYLTFKEFDKIKGNVWTPVFWPMFYIHRYLRYDISFLIYKNIKKHLMVDSYSID